MRFYQTYGKRIFDITCVSALAGAIRSLLGDVAKRDEMGGCGQERVTRELNPARVRTVLVREYRSLIPEKPGASDCHRRTGISRPLDGPILVPADQSDRPEVKNKKLLLTYGWCRTAYVAAESLAAAGYEVYACDESRMAMLRFSRYIKKFFAVPCPNTRPEAYARTVARIVEEINISVIIPVHEDMIALQRFRHLFHPETIIACPNLASLTKVMNKKAFHQAALDAGLSPPRTCVPATMKQAFAALNEVALPFVIKIRNGNSGKGVRMVHSRNDGSQALSDLIDLFHLSEDRLPLIQEYVEGEQCGIAFLAKEGEILGSFCERYLRFKQNKMGTSVLREAFQSEDLLHEAKKLCRSLNWTGLGQLDFIIDQSGKPRVLEMNPRFWGALRLAVACGQNFPVALVRLNKKKSVKECFSSAFVEKRCLWITGQLISTVGLLRSGKFRCAWTELWESLSEARRLEFDDLRLKDPLPLVAELLYYGIGFLKAGGSLNPESCVDRTGDMA
jgi:glutathione synthase/RimK-type ligase-like ATP-grasp enzyme